MAARTLDESCRTPMLCTNSAKPDRRARSLNLIARSRAVTGVTRATWEEEAGRWRVATDRGADPLFQELGPGGATVDLLPPKRLTHVPDGYRDGFLHIPSAVESRP